MAFTIGLKPEEFWNLTQWQFNKCVEGYGKSQEILKDLHAWSMWHGAMLSGVSGKSFPPLSKFQSKQDLTPSPTGEAMKIAFQEYNMKLKEKNSAGS